MKRPSGTRQRLFSAALLLGLGAAALAQSPEDFARQWPILGQHGEGLLRVELNQDVYAALQRGGLRDLVAFDASGQALALEPVALPAPPAERWPSRRLVLPLFHLPAELAHDTAERIELFIARGDDGRLRQLHADIGPAAAPGAGEVLLLDASAAQEPLQALVIELESGTESVDARVELQSSHDLSNWRSLGAPQALVRLSQNGLHLERLRLSLGGSDAAYLRLLRRDASAPLPIARIVAETRSGETRSEPKASWVTLSGAADPEHIGRFRYRLPGPLPVDRIAMAPASGSGAFSARLTSRSAAGAAAGLQLRAEQVVFQLGQGPEALRPETLRIAPLRDVEWVMDTEPAQALAPQLDLGFVPEQVLILAQGTAPFRLAAGSARAERAVVPLQPVLGQLRRRHGADWLPPLSALGVGSELSGMHALQPAPQPLPLRQILLWSVLLGGGLLVVGLVLRLLREPRPPA